MLAIHQLCQNILLAKRSTLKWGKDQQKGIFCRTIFFLLFFCSELLSSLFVPLDSSIVGRLKTYTLPKNIVNEYRFFFIVPGKEHLEERSKELGHELDKRKNLSHSSYPKPMLTPAYQCR